MTKKAPLSSATIKLLGSAAIAVLMTSPFGLVGAVQAAEVRHQEGEHLKPSGKGFGEQDPTGLTAAHAQPSTNGIFYHGGPVMLNAVKLYYIWYGAWDFSNDNTNMILNTFGGFIGGTRAVRWGLIRVHPCSSVANIFWPRMHTDAHG